jgi:hypothetical protein
MLVAYKHGYRIKWQLCDVMVVQCTEEKTILQYALYANIICDWKGTNRLQLLEQISQLYSSSEDVFRSPW